MATQASAEGWHYVACVEDFGDEDVLCVQVGGRQIALYNVDGEFYATDDMCSHGKACLSEGFLDGYLIECPLHQGLFDVRDGSPAGAPVTEGVDVYPVRRRGDELLVKV